MLLTVALLNGEEAAIGATASSTRILGGPPSIIVGQSAGVCVSTAGTMTPP